VQRNWQAVVQRLFAMRSARVGGSLQPAVVISLSNGTLKLGFDKAYEGLRLRCDGQLRNEIQDVLGKIAGQPVRCEFVSTGASGSVDFIAPRKLTLSSAEKNEIAKDPAVQMVLEMFEGELHEMIRKTPPAAAPTGDQDTE
jgi:hypothetical protein